MLNSVLDDNKTLNLPWGERVKLTPDVRIVIETYAKSAVNMTPAFVSRCGVIYFTSAAPDLITEEEAAARNLVLSKYGVYKPAGKYP